MRARTCGWAAVCVALVMAGPAGLRAESPPGDRPAFRSGDAPRARGREPQRKMEMLEWFWVVRELDLDEDDVAKVLPVMTRHAKRRGTLQREARAQFDDLHRLVRHGEGSDDELEELVDGILEAEAEMARISKEEVGEIAEALGRSQAARYLVARKKFRHRVEKEIRAMRERRSGDRGPRGRPGFPGEGRGHPDRPE